MFLIDKQAAAAALVMTAWMVGCGAEGDPGPAGAGTLMSSSSTDVLTEIPSACTNYLVVTIEAPSTGTVVVQTQSWVRIDHTSGTRDLALLLTADTPTTCSALTPYSSAVDVPDGAATAMTFHSVFLQRTFAVTAGTQTFYLNGQMTLGQNANDAFFYANMVAVFYPG